MAVEKFKPCYICWFFTISLAIATGILLSDAIRAGIAYLSLDKDSNSITQNSNKQSSMDNNKTTVLKNDTSKKETPIIKLSPKKEIPAIEASPNNEPVNNDKDVFIKVLPDKIIPKKGMSKKDMPGYQTTLEICNFWKKEHEKEATKQNAIYMEAACNRLKTYQ
jgi:hypothetical protein